MAKLPGGPDASAQRPRPAGAGRFCVIGGLCSQGPRIERHRDTLAREANRPGHFTLSATLAFDASPPRWGLRHGAAGWAPGDRQENGTHFGAPALLIVASTRLCS
jgi:hypothetical protein